MKGIKNPNYKHGKYCKKYYCTDCGKEVSVGSSRCMKCSNIIKARNKKSKFENYRRNSTCIDCNKKLKSHYALRCPSCSRKFIRRNKHWATNKGKKMSLLSRLKMSIARQGKFVGPKNPAWKNYKLIKDLDDAIRSLYEYKGWRRIIFERDNYTCQKCGKRGGKLEAHHKKEFVILLKEFLLQYSQFSPIEDKETLLRLATTYAPFWDVANGETLCRECHKLTKGVNQYSL